MTKPPPTPTCEPIRLPYESRFPGEFKVANWLAEVGDEIMTGDRIVEILTPGVVFVIEATTEGRLKRIDVPVDGSLTATTTLGWIEPPQQN